MIDMDAGVYGRRDEVATTGGPTPTHAVRPLRDRDRHPDLPRRNRPQRTQPPVGGPDRDPAARCRVPGWAQRQERRCFR